MPSYDLQNILILAIPFGCYFLGVLIRKLVFPGDSLMSLSHQFLLAIPVSLVVVPTLLPVLTSAQTSLSALLGTLGVLIEQGMVLNETAAQQIQERTKKAESAGPGINALSDRGS